MRVSRTSGAGPLICLCLFSNLVIANLAQQIKRAEPSLSTESSPRKTLTGGEEKGSETPSVTVTDSPEDSTTSTSASRETPTSSAVPTNTDVINPSLFETIIDEDNLPLEPEITPGFAVAGVIMVCTGVLYAVVGIKTRLVHAFLSTAFLGSLGTSVLIVYVMTPPVSNAIQGAYVVAVTCTGLILGGLAIVFKEITECLACLLGGFCLSMWLLTLQPGGVIQQTGGKVGFIAAFTLAGFGLYFTPWTRNYGMIACISFAGATVAVLGIDCFSRAGYKEFWAYLWALNDDLFPLGTYTYPLTRGIRVEIAVTILIFLAGVVSQLKLWRIIKDRRRKRDAERAEGERTLRAEEENVGRQVEEMTARERRRWERIYGDGTSSPVGGSADSGVGDMDSEKRIRHISITSAGPLGTRSQSPADTESGTGVMDLSLGEAIIPVLPRVTAAEKVISKADGSRVTVMVAQDDAPIGTIFEEFGKQDKGGAGILDGRESKLEYSIPSSWMGNSLSLELSPSITPLPFTVPEERTEEEERSSIATFADEDEPEPRPRTREGLDNVVRRLSNGSAKLFRSLSQRSKRDKEEHRNNGLRESREGLVELPSSVVKDESDSVAANLDDLSYVSDLVSFESWETPKEFSLHVKPDPKGDGPADENPQGVTEAQTAAQASPTVDWPFGTRIRGEETTLTSLSIPADSSVPAPKLGVSGVEEQAAKVDEAGSREKNQDAATSDQARSARDGDEMSHRRTSIDSVAASLTKGNLPSGLSRVAMSYRTNEWAKHLSAAETPEPETLQVEELIEEAFSDIASEGPAPLDLAELQQTPENAAVPPAAPRSASAMSNYGPQHTVTRSSSRTSLSGYDASGFPIHSSPTPDPQARYKTQPYRSLSGTLKGKASGLLAQPIAEEGDGELVRNTPTPVPEEGVSPLTGSRYNTPSPGPRELSTSTSTPNLSTWLNSQGIPAQNTQTQSPPQTLMGMREMLLRTKASAGLLTTPGPEAIYTLPDQRPPSEAGSIHNYPLYPTPSNDSPTPPLVDADDIPLSQRRAMIRQSSSLNFNTIKNQPYRSQSRASMQNLYKAASGGGGGTPTAEATAFDSHQPSRRSNIPPEAVRQAQLANFRSSVAADLRAGSPIDASAGSGGGAAAGWDSPVPMSIPMMMAPSIGVSIPNPLLASASMSSLRGAYSLQQTPYGQQPVVQVQGMEQPHRTLETQRSFMMSQKEAEMARREAERIEVERGQREFEERMRSSGAFMEAHRDAMRRMQARARE